MKTVIPVDSIASQTLAEEIMGLELGNLQHFDQRSLLVGKFTQFFLQTRIYHTV